MVIKSCKILFGCLLIMAATHSCSTDEGKVYLRVVNSIDVPHELTVRDNEKEIPADGSYYEVMGYAEAEYILLDMISDSIIDWTPDMIFRQALMWDTVIDEFYGEFEILEENSYYTLILNYRTEISDPVEHYYLQNVYHVNFRYFDNSQLLFSPAP